MKVYITARFKGSENQEDIERLCEAVKKSGMEDFCFVRDIENYKKTFDNPKELWTRSLSEIRKCEALLIDVSDEPSGGRVIEAGIAYALGLSVFVIAKNGVEFKDLYNGIATAVICYDEYDDIIPKLEHYQSTT